MSITQLNTLVIGINDEYKFEKLVKIIKYLCNHTEILMFRISSDGLYTQVQNRNHVILFELTLPFYWFDYYHFKINNNQSQIGLTIELNRFYQILQNRCPGFIWIAYDINTPQTIVINNEQCYYENPYNCPIPPEECYCELQNYPDFIVRDSLLNLPSNDEYQYHLQIDQQVFKQIIDELIQTGNTELTFHCSNVLQEVMLRTDKLFTILPNHNTTTETDDFVSAFNVNLLSQLPFNDFQCVVIYIFLKPNTPIKFVFPLDESDEHMDLNINISPNETRTNTLDSDFLHMCDAMNRTML